MKVIIIGNGIAGFSAAEDLRRIDDQCEITIISAEPYPLYSNCVLADYIAGRISREHVFIKSKEEYQNMKINTLWGHRVKEIDVAKKKVILENAQILDFGRLILATGSEPIILGKFKKGVFKLKTLLDADKIIRHQGKKAVIIGGGAIGIEIAIALHCRGYKVTIIELMKQILPLGLDEYAAIKAKAFLEEKGIEIFNEERAEKMIGKDKIEALATNKRELECDTLIWAIGMRPNVELARHAGIKIGEQGGIKVNAQMETNIQDIFACGDCVESQDIITGEYALSLFWHNALRQGKVAAKNCLGKKSDYLGSQNILNMDIFGNHIVAFGLTEAVLYRLKNKEPSERGSSEISIIEKESNSSYYRLIFSGERCIGGQFINPNLASRNIGFLWSLIWRKRNMQDIFKILKNKELAPKYLWVRRLENFLR